MTDFKQLARVERATQQYVDAVVERYGIVSALTRTRRLCFDPSYKRQPQWLRGAVRTLEALAKQREETLADMAKEEGR
jgi:hypothetical protein